MSSETDDRDAIFDISVKYAHYLDANDVDRFVELFTEEGEFVGSTSTIRGRAELRAFVEKRKSGPSYQGRHIVVNPLIEITNDDATMRSYFLFSQGNPPALLNAGVFEDSLRRVDGVWRITRRTFVPD
jgi:uncharacterized protein (TIGR02246 family)